MQQHYLQEAVTGIISAHQAVCGIPGPLEGAQNIACGLEQPHRHSRDLRGQPLEHQAWAGMASKAQRGGMAASKSQSAS